MNKWFEEIDYKDSNVIYSRVRLARNWDEYVFPFRMTATQYGETVEHLEEGLKGLKDQDGRDLSHSQLNQTQKLEKMVLKERRILNMVCVNRKEPLELLLPADKSDNIVLGGDNHIRMQILSSGLKLDESWQKANALDDYVNERFPYALNEKYRYLTSFPTNMGTGLRTCVVLYLPTSSQVRKSQSIMAGMSRFGIAIRGLYREGSDNYGSLCEVSSQGTLGQSEKEIVELVTEAAAQLNNQEVRVRSATLSTQCLKRGDETYKSYGVLKHTGKMSEKGARIFISQLMAGEKDGLVKLNEKCSPYSLAIGIKPISLNLWARRLLDRGELDAVRAAYIRQNLPEVI